MRNQLLGTKKVFCRFVIITRSWFVINEIILWDIKHLLADVLELFLWHNFHVYVHVFVLICAFCLLYTIWIFLRWVFSKQKFSITRNKTCYHGYRNQFKLSSSGLDVTVPKITHEIMHAPIWKIFGFVCLMTTMLLRYYKRLISDMRNVVTDKWYFFAFFISRHFFHVLCFFFSLQIGNEWPISIMN